MRIDRRELGRHYASITDEELLALNREDLTETARVIYDLEIGRRGLNADSSFEKEPDASGTTLRQSGIFIEGEGPDPDWLQNAACACSFAVTPGDSGAEKASQAQTALQAAGIPSCLRAAQAEERSDGRSNYELNVMVPLAQMLSAASILERDFFNVEFESEWRAQLQMFSDKDLRALDPAIFCAGLLDRVARMKKAYAEELAKRNC
jgi:hypothetical protein